MLHDNNLIYFLPFIVPNKNTTLRVAVLEMVPAPNQFPHFISYNFMYNSQFVEYTNSMVEYLFTVYEWPNRV